MIRLIVGLGNPGAEHAGTRHNAGFDVVDCYSGGERFKRKFGTAAKVCRAGNPRALLAKPQTYMNRSGEAVLALLNKYGLKPAEMVVVFDDLDLDSGTIRIRKSGGTGGHNGLKSIASSLGTDAYPRLRIGIGPRPNGADTVDYVLGTWSAEQHSDRDAAYDKAVKALQLAVSRGLVAAMNDFNKK